MAGDLSRRIKIFGVVAVALAIGYFVFYLRAEAPVYSGEPDTMVLKVFFGNSVLDPEVSCDKVFAVDREVPRTVAPARVALEKLLEGPTQTEKDEGFSSSINSGVQIKNLTILDGTATVDFDSKLEESVGGSCRVTAIRAEITETLKQFPTVDEVVISVDGRTEDILQP